MRQASVPSTTARGWAALSAASVLGTNLGDLAAHDLHLGHLGGLPILALAFALVLAAERRLGGEAWYWLAIVLLRTAATNLADLATHDAGLSPPATIAALSALLCAVLLARGFATPNACPDSAGRPVPVTDPGYWATMLTAGTLGTVAGDLFEDTAGLGASAIACAALLLAAVIGCRALPRPGAVAYWATILVARTASTTLGDVAASRAGLGLGLPLASACSGALLVALLLLWPRTPARAAPGPAPDRRPAPARPRRD